MSDLFFDGGVVKSVTRASADTTRPVVGDEVALVYSISADRTQQSRNLVYTVGRSQTDLFIPIITLDRIVTSMRRGEKCTVNISPRYSTASFPMVVELTLVHIRPGRAAGQVPSTSSTSSTGPDVMEQMMSSPYMQSLLADPNTMNAMFQSNPQMQQLMEQNPEVRSLMSDPEFLQQSMQMMRNPNMMREMMRNTDRAMSNIESLPGGSAALHKLYNEVQAPLMDATLDGGLLPTNDAVKDAAQLKAKYGESIKPKKPTTEPMANPWAPKVPMSSPQIMPNNALNRGGNSFDMSSMMQMMQNPSMQQLMSSMMMPPAGSHNGVPQQSVPHSSPILVPAEMRYRTELATLRSMGFTDNAACIRALDRTLGNVDMAADLLISEASAGTSSAPPTNDRNPSSQS